MAQKAMQEPKGLPKNMGSYVLVREAGRGGMSTVYEAVDTRIGRTVALKVLAIPPYLSPEQREQLTKRMQREARAVGRLSHPNVVAIYDVGEQDGYRYLVMEFLDGVTLRARMDGGPLSPAEASGVLDQVAAGLDAIHAHGIVHRDVKPGNVMLLPDGRVKLMDFGVARQADDTTVTQAGMTVGSPAYMAPEQVRGEAGTAASDRWALGVLLYEMLVGRPPFAGENIPSILYQVAHQEPAPAPHASPAVQRVLLRALEKDPVKRFASGGELADAFRAATDATIVQPRRPKSRPADGRSVAAPPAPAPSRPARKRSGRAASRPWLPALLLLALIPPLFVIARSRMPADTGTGKAGGGSAPDSVQITEADTPPRPSKPRPAGEQSGPRKAGAETARPPREAVAEAPEGPARPARRPAPAAAPPRPERRQEPPARVAPSAAAKRDRSEEKRRGDEEARRPARETPERRERARAAETPDEAVPRSTAARPRLLGTWRGRHTNSPATLRITGRDGDAFSGTMTVQTGEGTVRIAVAGSVSPDTRRVTLRETRVLSEEQRQSWDLGSNAGRLSGDGEMAGTGRDARGRSYAWSFSR